MKVWQSSGKHVTLKRDTNWIRQSSPTVFFDNVEEAAIKPLNIRKIIEKEWPDNTTYWKRSVLRSAADCVSPQAKQWQCGSINGEKFCHRIQGHRGSCSDLFCPADKQEITRRMSKSRLEEHDGVLCRRPVSTPQRYDLNKLRKILRESE